MFSLPGQSKTEITGFVLLIQTKINPEIKTRKGKEFPQYGFSMTASDLGEKKSIQALLSDEIF